MSTPVDPFSRRSQKGRNGSGGARRGAPRTPPKETSAGAGSTFARHPSAWLASTLGVVFLLLATGALLAGAAVGNASPGSTPSPSHSAQTGRALPAQLPPGNHLRTCSVSALAADAKLSAFSGAVVNATTGEVLFDRGASTPARAGNLVKLITAGAALAILGPDYQLSTRVYDGGAPGTIVFVGGGDPTISALPAGQQSVYSGAPKLDDLAASAKEQYDILHPGVPITNIVLDSSMWDANDNWDSTWKRKEQTQGYQSEVTALQVDGDRADPTSQVSPRTTDPVARAGQLFKSAWPGGLSGVTFSTGSAIASKPLLAQVNSQPVSTLVNQMLVSGDGTLAESLARVVSKTMGFGGSSGSLQQAIPSALAIYQVDSSKLTIHDGSGLSEANAVSPEFLSQYLVKILNGGNNLNYIYNSLSIAGKNGSLASRFTGGNAVARKSIMGMSGTLDSEYDLAGIVTAADGSQLTFVFYAISPGIKSAAKGALDTLATGVYNCGNNLAND